MMLSIVLLSFTFISLGVSQSETPANNQIVLDIPKDLNAEDVDLAFHICWGESITIKCKYGFYWDSTRYRNSIWSSAYDEYSTERKMFERIEDAFLVVKADEQQSKERSYYCKMNPFSDYGEQHVSRQIKLVVQNCSSDPVRSFRKFKGDNLTVPCLQASDYDIIQWQIDGHILPNETWSLDLPNLTLSDVGTYRCLTKSRYLTKPDPRGHPMADSVLLSIAYVASFNLTMVPSFVPNFRVSNVTQTTAKFTWDSKLKMKNRVGVEHTLDIEKPWGVHLARLTKDDSNQHPKMNFSKMTDLGDGILVEKLRPGSFYRADLVPRLQTRPYTNRPIFFMTHAEGIDSDPSLNLEHVIGKYPETDIGDPQRVLVNLGEPAELFCGVDHKRTINFQRIQWWRNHWPIKEQEIQYRQRPGDSLYIPLVLQRDLGIYECFIYLTDTPIPVYMHRMLVSINDSLSDTDRLPSPTNVQCSNITHNSLNVNWLAPEEIQSGNARISGYKIRYWLKLAPYKLKKSNQRMEGSRTMITLTNLEPESVYTIEVVAFDEIGESKAAKWNCFTGSEP